MTKKVESEGKNRRANLRYRDTESTVIDLLTKIDNINSPTFKALIVNESFKGFAVVYVGDGNIKKNDTIYWQETEKLQTSCLVIRSTKLEDDVYSLALRIVE
jgi:hypothetical protein